MKRILSFFSGALLLFNLMACTPFGGFKPAPEWWTYFKRNGATEKEVRLALLECGSSTPGYYTEFIMPNGKQFPETNSNESVMVRKCMVKSGFTYKRDFDVCTDWIIDMHGNSKPPRDIPACKPDAVIPKRSVETRLNSPYCKVYPRVSICQPNYDPSAATAKPTSKLNNLSITPAPSTDPATRLQEQVQKQSNAQMNQMLQGAGSRKR